jgi:hypothetical protein
MTNGLGASPFFGPAHQKFHPGRVQRPTTASLLAHRRRQSIPARWTGPLAVVIAADRWRWPFHQSSQARSLSVLLGWAH